MTLYYFEPFLLIAAKVKNFFFFTVVYSYITVLTVNIQLKHQVFIQVNIICKTSMKSNQLADMFFWQINFITSP